MKDKFNNKWVLYNLIAAFALYWLSNVILWYPWSYSTGLGIAIMLSVNPVIWGFAIYGCLSRYKGDRRMLSALICAGAMLIVSVISDFVFFGLIRNAMEELYRPTTFYGYMFIFSIPFIEVFLFKKKLAEKRKDLFKTDFIKMAVLGLACVVIIAVIIAFDLNIS